MVTLGVKLRSDVVGPSFDACVSATLRAVVQSVLDPFHCDELKKFLCPKRFEDLLKKLQSSFTVVITLVVQFLAKVSASVATQKNNTTKHNEPPEGMKLQTT